MGNPFADREGKFWVSWAEPIKAFVPAMSDEPKPLPSLRLKPRLRPADTEAHPAAGEPAVAAPVTTAPAIPAQASEGAAAPRVRLTPRLPVEPPAAVEAPASVSPTPPALVPEPPTPPLFVPATIPPTPLESIPAVPSLEPAPTEGAKFKLKPRTSGGEPLPVLFKTDDPPPAPVAVETSPAPPPAVAAPGSSASPVPPKSVPPFPVVAGAGPAPRPAPVPHLKLKVSAAPTPPGPMPAPKPPRPRRRVGRLLYLAGTPVALGAIGFFGWPHIKSGAAALLSRVDGSVANAGTAAPASKKGLTPSETLNKIAEAPANAVAKAQEAIEKRRASGQLRVDATAAGEDVPEKPAAPARPAPAPRVLDSQPAAMTSVAPGLAAPVHIEAMAEASPAFRAFAANAKVNGVFQGSPARAMINGRLVRIGQDVDSALGIVLESVDSEKKQLILKDRSGAIVARKY